MIMLKLLQEINPRFKHNANSHIGMRNYFHFFSTYIKCRNHIIHTDGFISVVSYSKFGHINQKFARDWFGVQLIGKKKKNKYIINTSQRAAEILTTLVELANLIISSFDQSLNTKLTKR